MLRINGLDTPFAYRDLIEVVEAAGDRLDLIMLPKAGSDRDVAFVDTLLTQIESELRLLAPDRDRGADRNGRRLPGRARNCPVPRRGWKR